MKIYPHKGREKDLGVIWIDDHPRELSLTWKQFQLLCEVLNGYTSEMQTKPPKPKVKVLEKYLVEDWHRQDREVPAPRD